MDTPKMSESERRQLLWSLALHIKERMSAQVGGLRRYTPQVRVIRRGAVPYVGR